MFETRLTKLLGIKYPIIQGGLQWLATAQLASAVSDAGGLGIISSLSFPDQDSLRKEIRRIRGMTKKPFGVNLSMLPELTRSTAPSTVFEGGVDKRRSELALSEVEGVNPEQARAFRLGSRRVDKGR